MTKDVIKWGEMEDRDRNALIAEKVMGWKRWDGAYPIVVWETGDRGNPTRAYFQPSKTIGDAMLVLEKFDDVQIQKETYPSGKKDWSVTINQDWTLVGWGRVSYGCAESLAEAVCKAALGAVGIDVGITFS